MKPPWNSSSHAASLLTKQKWHTFRTATPERWIIHCCKSESGKLLKKNRFEPVGSDSITLLLPCLFFFENFGTLLLENEMYENKEKLFCFQVFYLHISPVSFLLWFSTLLCTWSKIYLIYWRSHPVTVNIRDIERVLWLETAESPSSKQCQLPKSFFLTMNASSYLY